MQTAPRIIIIAGPNGAGKTTFAREFLPNEAACPVFVNADLIAAGSAPFAPEAAALQAGRLGSPDEAIARVAQRVKQGGHHIPEDVIWRRFVAGKANFEKYYAPIADAWALYDNSGTEPVLLQWNERP